MNAPQPQQQDSRFNEMLHWFESLQEQIAGGLDLSQLSDGAFSAIGSDASFRRYFRWQKQRNSLVIMDAPPERENCRPFVAVANLLQQAGLNVPQVLAQDLERGFLLLSDLGQKTWLETINEQNADDYFSLAIDLLIRLQQITPPADMMANYDAALLRRELDLFVDWYVKCELGMELNQQQRQYWEDSCAFLLQAALQQNKVLVHRDYMPRNLMQSTPNPGLLDFQDAVIGPVSYDITSLFKDAFISWSQARIDGWIEQYWRKAQACGIAVPETLADFYRDCDLMGVQRHLKVIGIFARICHRDGKPKYLQDVPRFFNYLVAILPKYPELAPLSLLLKSLDMEITA